MKTIAIIGTFDTKGKEFAFLRDLIREQGLETLCIHTGAFEPSFEPDVTNEEVAAAVGASMKEIAEKKDRGFRDGHHEPRRGEAHPGAIRAGAV